MKLFANGRSAVAWVAAWAFAVMSGISISPALAADPDTASSPTQLEKVEVTGSRIRRTDYETAAPVQVINRVDIERSGRQSIADVLRTISADGQGSIPESFSAGFASGSSAVSLRGLGVNSTLILVNGRRTAPYGLADDGARTFSDLNSIPLDIVDRIEILKDGASAIYGSDAVGGVVNIILRKSYEGGSISGKIGTSYKNDGNLQGGAGTLGFGNLSRDHYNAYISVEGLTNDKIDESSRSDYLGTLDFRPQGGFDNRNGAFIGGGGLFPSGRPVFSRNSPYGFIGSPDTGQNLTPCLEKNPVTGFCIFDPVVYNQVQPEQNRLSVFSRGTVRLTDSARFYTELSYLRSQTKSLGTPASFTFGNSFNAGDPANPVFPLKRPILPADHPDNPTGGPVAVRYLAADVGGRTDNSTNYLTRYLVGIQGDLSDWNYDVGAMYTESRLEQVRSGFPQFTPLQNALKGMGPGGTTYRINNRAANPDSLYASIFPDLINVANTSVALIDAHIAGPLVALPGGPLSLAAGAEWRRETNELPPIAGTGNGETGGLGFSAYDSKRRVYATYAELNAPVIRQVEITGAVRYDHYSDYGSSTTPKAGVKVRPVDWLALRGTYSRAFRAPGPAENGNSASFGFTNIGILTVGNPNVRPEKAENFTAGFVLEPTKDTYLTMDYYWIKRKDEIVQSDPSAIIGSNPSNGGTPDSIIPGEQPGSLIYYNEQGQIFAISGGYQNANKTKTSGVDLDFSHRFALIGEKFKANLSWTHIISFRKILDDGSTFEYAGTHGPVAISSGSGTPQDRGVARLTWESGPFTVAASMNYVGPLKMVDYRGERLADNEDGTFGGSAGSYFIAAGQPTCAVFNPDGTAPRDCKVASFTTFDLFGKWNVTQQFEITGSVQNVANRKAPFDPYIVQAGYPTNYNQAFHQDGGVGRFYILGAKYSFGSFY